jgi:phosphate transport system substrate-binding protein
MVRQLSGWSLAFSILFSVGACGGGAPPSSPVAVDGSSTVYPLSSAIGEAFTKANRNVQVAVSFSGTGPGFRKLCGGQIDVGNASRPITTAEAQSCESNGVKFIELPVGYDGLTVIVNPKNTWADTVTVAELRTLWEPAAEKKVLRWSAVRPGWPDREIPLFGPDVESGTFDYFTDAIMGKPRASRTDYSANTDDERIVDGVASDELALGYLGYGYFDRNRSRVKALSLDDLKDDVGAGPIEPSAANVSRGTYRPLSRPLFIYVNAERLNRPEVKAFVQFYLAQAAGAAERTGVIALTGYASDRVRQRFDKRVSGTMYTAPNSANLSLDYLLDQ